MSSPWVRQQQGPIMQNQHLVWQRCFINDWNRGLHRTALLFNGGLTSVFLFRFWLFVFFSAAIQMEDQAEPGLFLPHDVRSEQRGLLRPGTSEEKRKCLSRTELPALPPPSPAGATFTHSQPDPSRPCASLISLLGKSQSPIWLRLHESRADANVGLWHASTKDSPQTFTV